MTPAKYIPVAQWTFGLIDQYNTTQQDKVVKNIIVCAANEGKAERLAYEFMKNSTDKDDEYYFKMMALGAYGLKRLKVEPNPAHLAYLQSEEYAAYCAEADAEIRAKINKINDERRASLLRPK